MTGSLTVGRLTLLLLAGSAFTSSANGQHQVYRIPVTGTIENGLAPFIARSLREAAEAGAKAAILDLDTPGGRVDAAERIVDAIRASSIPVYAFVNPRAFSAGAMIALATNGIYMVPGGVMGAATPVDGGGVKAPEKYVSAMRAEFRALAEANGLDPKIAEGMVDETIDIPGVKPAGQLLTLSTSEALQVGFAKAEVRDLDGVLNAIMHDGALMVQAEPNWAELLVRFFTHPMVSPLLLSLGMLGLIFEIKSGAFGLGGLVSLASLGLFFGSHLLLGLAGWEEVLLLGIGLIALGVEVFLLPGFGVAGIVGIVLITGSMLLSLIGAGPTFTDFLQAGAVMAAAFLVTGAVLFGWLRHLPNSQRWSGLFLRDSTKAGEGFISALPRGDLVGRSGVAQTDLRPSGTATVDGERLDVVTEGEWVKAGAAVTVIRSEGYRHIVRASNN
jgi:membrane-bound serine protease (ClpP class)